MEQKTIPLNKGIVRNTSLATDGELIDCVNLMPKNGQMMNAPILTEALTETGETITLGNKETLLYIHPTSVKNVYVVKYSNKGDIIIAYKKEDSNVEICTLPPDAELYEVKHIGNVLVVLTSKRTAMFLYKDGGYIDYTFDFDNLDIAFGLEGSRVTESKDSQITFSKIELGNQTYKNTTIAADSWETYTGVGTVDIPFILKNGYSYKIKANRIDGETGNYSYALGKIYSNGDRKLIEGTRSNTRFEYIKVTEDNLVGLYFASIDLINPLPSKGSYSIWESITENTWRVSDDYIDTVLGHANSFITDQSLKQGQFIFPFFIRYAIELLDGTHIKPSAPCLMIPSTGIVPYVQLLETFKDNVVDTKARDIYTSAFVAKLTYRINSDVEKLKAMSHIIKGVSIAITPPIYRYNQGATPEEIKEKYLRLMPYHETSNDYTYALITGSEKYLRYSKKDIDKLGNTEINDNTLYNISLPTFDEIDKQIENASTFRIIHSIPLETLDKTEGFVDMELEEGVLEGLDGKQILTDDTQSLHKYVARTAFTYNNRLNIANFNELIFPGCKPSLSNNWMQGYSSSSELTDTYEFAVETTHSRNMVDVVSKVVDKTDAHPSLQWLYYPNADATTVDIYRVEKGKGTNYGYKTTIKLKKHPYLNGAYWFNNFNPIDFKSIGDASDFITDSVSPSMSSPNKIKTSEVNNPFVMKQTTSLNDDIVALATTTKAISEGQFGQFPLYAFCNDGIWALEPSSDGTYASKQPVSRDVCSNPKAITQTDNAVVFPTLQGLKVLQGGTTANISNVMDGKAEDISFLKDVIAEYNDLCLTDNTDFNKAIQDASIVYDYVNNLLHIYAENASYIYNLSSGDWTRTDDEKPKAIVPGYPYSTIQVETKLYRYEKPSADGTRKGMLLTRETAFDDPLTMKIIKDLRVMRRHGNAKIAVWVSNDRQNWGRLTSLRMHSYKWYRFAIFTELNNTDALEGIVARIESRKTNKMR